MGFFLLPRCRYLTSIWCIFFILLFISAIGICGFSRSSILLVCIVPLTPAMIVIRVLFSNLVLLLCLLAGCNWFLLFLWLVQ